MYKYLNVINTVYSKICKKLQEKSFQILNAHFKTACMYKYKYKWNKCNRICGDQKQRRGQRIDWCTMKTVQTETSINASLNGNKRLLRPLYRLKVTQWFSSDLHLSCHDEFHVLPWSSFRLIRANAGPGHPLSQLFIMLPSILAFHLSKYRGWSKRITPVAWPFQPFANANGGVNNVLWARDA